MQQKGCKVNLLEKTVDGWYGGSWRGTILREGVPKLELCNEAGEVVPKLEVCANSEWTDTFGGDPCKAGIDGNCITIENIKI